MVIIRIPIPTAITHTLTVITAIMALGYGVRVTGVMVDGIMVIGGTGGTGGTIDSTFFDQLSFQGRKRGIEKVFLK